MLEVCVDSFESAAAAVNGGANRIELCSALSEGGLTPTTGLLKAIKAKFPGTPVFAMLRPHSRISYRHTSTDMDIIMCDMDDLKAAGADGFVFGALTADRAIDGPACQTVIERAAGLPVTFHRAFDMSSPAMMLPNVSTLSQLGFARLLSSGYAQSAYIGLDALMKIQRHIRETGLAIKLMPGCGVTADNAAQILSSSGCKEFHATAKRNRAEAIPNKHLDSGAIEKAVGTNAYSETDEDTVRVLVRIGRSFLERQ